ncbi:MAG: hypothetical protein APF76_16590 [Desulfitibacter sp. BRH_c19]|nr:MAG: hypothetical protein APF76_16590 [Desulfitibacter sp. BRH_c19]
MLVLLLMFFLWKQVTLRRFGHHEVVELEITLGGMGRMLIKPSYDEMRIAHKAWVELSTRKAGLLFDEEDDVIVEVYDSWYQLFREMRVLVKEIPIERIRTQKSTGQLVKVLIGALNKGLRPHLTRWQAKFRRWYEWRIEQENKNDGMLTPQELQREYPHYEQLKEELKIINVELIQYVNELEKLAHGDKP